MAGVIKDLGSIRVSLIADLNQARLALASFSQTIGTATKGISTRLKEIGSGFADLTTIVSAGFGLKALESFKDLEQSFTELRRALGLTAAEFEPLRQRITTFAFAGGPPLDKLVDGMRRFAFVTSDVNQLLKLSVTAMQGGKVTMSDAAVAADALNNSLQSFNRPLTEAGKVMAQLASASERSRIGLGEFAQGLATIGPLANQSGLSLEETIAVLKELSKQTGSAGEAAAKMRVLLTTMAGMDPASKQGVRLAEALGMTVQQSIKVRGLTETLRQMAASAGGIENLTQAIDGTTDATANLLQENRASIAAQRILLNSDSIRNEQLKLGALSAADLTKEYADQKRQLIELGKETKKLVTNSIYQFFDRIRFALVGTLQEVNKFIVSNKTLVGVLVSTGLVLSAYAIALTALKFTFTQVAISIKFLAVPLLGLAATLKAGVVPAFLAAGATIVTFVRNIAASITLITSMSVALTVLRNAAVGCTLALTILSGVIGAIVVVFGTVLAGSYYLTRYLLGLGTTANDAADAFTRLYQSQRQQQQLARQTQNNNDIKDRVKAVAELREQLRAAGRTAADPLADPVARQAALKSIKEIAVALREEGVAGANALEQLNTREQQIIETIAKGRDLIEKRNPGSGGAASATQAITVALEAQGVKLADAAVMAEKYTVELGEIVRMQLQLKATSEATINAMVQAAQATNRLTQATTEARAAGDALDKSTKDLIENISDASLTDAARETKKYSDAVNKLSEALTEALKIQNELILNSFTTTDNKDVKAARKEAQDRVNAIRDALGKAKDLRDKAIADEQRDRIEKEQETLDEISQMQIEAMRKKGEQRAADELVAKLELQKSLREAAALREAGEIDLAKRKEDAARQLYDATLGFIAEEDKKRKESSDQYQRLKQKEEDQVRRLEALKLAELLKQQAEQAKLNGDVRLEKTLRQEAAAAIRDANDAAQDALLTEEELLAKVRERLSLAKEDVKSKLRAGAQPGDTADIARGLQQDIVGGSSVVGFRAGARSAFGQTTTEKGAKELFDIIKQSLEAEYNSLRQDRGAAKTDEERNKIDQQMRDTLEKYRITQDELNKALKEIKKQGPRPDTPVVIDQSRLKPGEQGAPGVTVIGGSPGSPVLDAGGKPIIGDDGQPLETSPLYPEDVPGAATPGGPGDIVTGIGNAASGVLTGVNGLAAAVSNLGSTIITTLDTIAVKLGDAIDQLNTNTNAILDIENNVLGYRIEGRDSRG